MYVLVCEAGAVLIVVCVFILIHPTEVCPRQIYPSFIDIPSAMSATYPSRVAR